MVRSIGIKGDDILSKRFLISDMHFGHSRIMEYEERPFEKVEDMDEVIIKNWNDVVHKDDIIFVLGDVSFYPKEKTKQIISQLKGRKFLILGNHDMGRSETFWKDVGFEFVSKYPICVDEFYWMSHEPMYLSSTMPYVNVHGHIHSKIMSTDKQPNQYVNVSVERVGYKPIDFEDIKRMFNIEQRED